METHNKNSELNTTYIDDFLKNKKDTVEKLSLFNRLKVKFKLEQIIEKKPDIEDYPWYCFLYVAHFGERVVKKRIVLNLKKIATKENSNIARMVAKFYYNGKGVNKDIKEAIKFYEIACDGNNNDAQYELGLILSQGEELEVDIDKAFALFQTAALQGHSAAQYEYAKCVKWELELKRIMKLHFFVIKKQHYKVIKIQ